MFTRKNSSTLPQIAEVYRDYTPPCNVRRRCRNASEAHPSRESDRTKKRRSDEFFMFVAGPTSPKDLDRNRKVQLSECLGWYSHSTRASGARITLLIDNIFRRAKKSRFGSPFFGRCFCASVLFHEVGTSYPRDTASRKSRRGRMWPIAGKRNWKGNSFAKDIGTYFRSLSQSNW